MHSIHGLTFSLPKLRYKHLVSLAFFLLIFVGLLIPARSGGHPIKDPRLLAFILSISTFSLFYFKRQSLSFQQLASLFTMLSLVTFASFYVFKALAHPSIPLKEQASESMQFFITFSIPLMALFLIQEKVITAQKFFLWVIHINLLYMILKCIILALHIMGIIEITTILTALKFSSMQTGIWGVLQRWQTSLDLLAPFLIFFVLQHKKLKLGVSTKFVAIYCLLALITTFFGYSRFLFAVFGASVCLHIATLSGLRLIRSTALIVALIIATIFAVGPDRFFSILLRNKQENTASDLHRIKQVEAMVTEIDKAPILGKGMGASVRSPVFNNSFRFEVQWVSFLMQFGIFGILILLIPFLIIFWQLLKPPLTRSHFACFCLFGIWMLSGFTNPFLISLQSGIIYTLFLLFPRYQHIDREPTQN